jgi:hypothetical protein
MQPRVGLAIIWVDGLPVIDGNKLIAAIKARFVTGRLWYIPSKN